jgi:hypothetical protein
MSMVRTKIGFCTILLTISKYFVPTYGCGAAAAVSCFLPESRARYHRATTFGGMASPPAVPPFFILPLFYPLFFPIVDGLNLTAHSERPLSRQRGKSHDRTAQ